MNRRKRRGLNAKISDLAKFCTMHLWGEELNVPISVNYKHKDYLGMFVPNRLIELSSEVVKNEYALVDTLLHELCHWYCYETGLDYDDDEQDFIDEVENTGCTLTGDTTFKGGEYVKYIGSSEYREFEPSDKMITILKSYKESTMVTN